MKNEKRTIIAKRYAEALIEFGKSEQLSYVAISTDLAAIQSVLSHSKDLYETLTNPLISVQDKEYVIDKVFEKDVDVLIRNFLKLLVEKNRFDLINDIIQLYNTILDDINEIARIEVISAVELNDTEKLKIQDKLTEKLNKQISIKYKTDSSVIAGLIVKMGDNIIDMSVARKLEEYKMTLIK